MPDLTTTTFVVIALALFVGTFVQSVVGLGLGLVAAPVIALLAPQLMPGTMVMLASFLPLVTLSREHEDIDWFGLGWSMPARVVGTVAGVWVVANASDRQLGVGVGIIVLAAVLLTARTVRVPITRVTLGVAGFVGGVAGTTTSIGGPPFALLYQRRPPRQLRTTLAVYFLLGAVMSLVGLGLAGELTTEEVAFAAAMVPALVVGFAISGPLRRRLRTDVVRPLVLLVSAASSLVLLVRSLLG